MITRPITGFLLHFTLITMATNLPKGNLLFEGSEPSKAQNF